MNGYVTLLVLSRAGADAPGKPAPAQSLRGTIRFVRRFLLKLDRAG
ncbi:MAG: hypothetical protein GKS00_10045 [Alphaproteobacteria bacterium]|nr:hypothetical protein [Alphaproteobacteria bacterium]